MEIQSGEEFAETMHELWCRHGTPHSEIIPRCQELISARDAAIRKQAVDRILAVLQNQKLIGADAVDHLKWIGEV